MWTATTSTRNALALLLAAGVAFLGCAAIVNAGRVLPGVAGGGPGAAIPELILAVVVVLLAIAGVLLLALAAGQLLSHRHRPRRR